MCSMKKNSRMKSGAALVIAVAASAVVLLSASLLLGYLNGMIRQQGRLELMAQARLSQASAADWARAQLLRGDFPDDPVRMETGGLLTELIPLERNPAPPLTLTLGDFCSAGAAPVACSGGVVVVEQSGESLLLGLLSIPDLRQVEGFPLTIPSGGSPFLVAGFGEGSDEYACMVAIKRQGELEVYLVGLDGSLSSVDCPGRGLPDDARAEAGIVDGETVLLLSGPDQSVRISFPTGDAVGLRPLPGTCPVFLAGRILCVAPDQAIPSPGSILDVFRGDFDLDGSPDVAWAAQASMTVWLSSRQGTESDRRSGSALRAWGFLDQISGLACCWEGPDGAMCWSRLSWNGFQETAASGPMRLPWRGRVESGGNLVLGILADSLAMASADGGAPAGLGDCSRAIWGVYDGGPVDAACLDGTGWKLVLDPEDGGGVDISFRALTSADGEPVLSRSFSFRLYSGEQGMRRIYGGGFTG
jgi:hypothetical protein